MTKFSDYSKARKNKKVHFIGIGGIGVSALARYFLSKRSQISGSDLKKSEITDELKKAGAKIFIGHKPQNISKKTALAIYSPAVKKNNPELKAARKLKIKTLSYPQALGELTRQYCTIAVSGSHGKSTTTALVALILIKAGFDPTVILGAKLKEFGNSNFRKGESRYLVIEADEWDRSFHNYFPKIIVLTNIDKEHLDTYKNFRGVAAGFARYLKNLVSGGFLVANYKDKTIHRLAAKISQEKKAKVIYYNRDKFKRHPLVIPGEHNQINAEAAWQTAKFLGIKEILADKVFKNYQGAWRRLEKLEIRNKKLEAGIIYTDYAHHPTEIKATLSALREKYPKEKTVCVFQPHQQERLTKLFKDFVHAFDMADFLIILPVYKVSGRDDLPNAGNTNSFSLVQKIKQHKNEVFYAQNFSAALKIIKNSLAGKGVIVFMSAGDLDSRLRKFLKN